MTDAPARTDGRDPAVVELLRRLAEPFDPGEIKWKPQQVKNNRCLAIAYIDARLIEDRLDEVLGGENWKNEYQPLHDGNVECRLTIRLGGEWIGKSDVGGPSEQPDPGDRMKAAYSDSLKRAAVKFGIGRYLYRLGQSWVDYDPVKKMIAVKPQLPAFAIPARQQGEKLARGGVSMTAAPGTKPPTVGPKGGTGTPPKQLAQELKVAPPKEAPPALPANGGELFRRLQDYDSKLAGQKLCERGALLAHVTAAGVRAGYTANMSEWSGAAIPFAVDAVRAFDAGVRKEQAAGRDAGGTDTAPAA